MTPYIKPGTFLAKYMQYMSVQETPREYDFACRFVVPQCSIGEISNCGQTACACALKHVRDLGVREWHIEKIVLYPRLGWHRAFFHVTATIKDAANREQDHDGSAAQ